MNVQAALADIIKQTALANVDILKITGGEETRVQTFDTDKTLFIEGELKSPVGDFVGEFGITNLKMLSGLLNFTNFQTDDASFKVRTRDINGTKTLDQFEFKGSGSRSVFKLMDIQHVPEQAKIANIPWDVVLDEISKPKVTEFTQFAGMYSEIDKHFVITVADGDLVITLGQEASSSHSGSMVFASGVTGSFSGALTFPVDKFLMLLKLALTAKSARIMFTNKGLLGVETTTDAGTYRYYLRQSVRG